MRQEHAVDIGTVPQLYRAPVKSMALEQISSAYITETGFLGDRTYAFLQRDSKSAFPWFTLRNLPQLTLYKPHFAEPDNEKKSSVLVTTPSGEDLPIESDQLRLELEQLAHRPLHLLRLGRGTYDAYPVSIISTESVISLSDKVGHPLDIRRLRPNIVAEIYPSLNFDTESLDSILTFGDRPDSPQVHVAMQDPRCKIPNIDPDTAVVDKNIAKFLLQDFNNNLGVYASVLKPGRVNTGDTINMFKLS